MSQCGTDRAEPLMDDGVYDPDVPDQAAWDHDAAPIEETLDENLDEICKI